MKSQSVVQDTSTATTLSITITIITMVTTTTTITIIITAIHHKIINSQNSRTCVSVWMKILRRWKKWPECNSGPRRVILNCIERGSGTAKCDEKGSENGVGNG
uniref:Uncharacterized protein n=1 Tax=Cacopsylla melanoneura TaxID=428564 RepID=A0A8D8Y5I6_9HEMI